MSDKKETARGCSSVIIIFFGIGFAFMIVETIFGFIFSGKSFLSSFLDPDSEGTNLGLLQFTFWTLAIAVVVFLIAGGKFSDIFKKK